VLVLPRFLPSPLHLLQSVHDGVKQALQLRATQIPDFLRIIFLVTGNQVIKRVDLIVENKRTYQDRTRYLTALVVQTFKQAQFVFSNDSDVQVVACIMAIGEYWAYREVTRGEAEVSQMEEQIRGSRGKDTVYSPSPEPTNSSSSFFQAPVSPCYPFLINPDTDSDAFLQLQEAFPELDSMVSISSDKTTMLFDIIRTRLKEINLDMWSNN